MEATTGSFITPDGTMIFTRLWLPDGDPQGAILLTHGFAEHSGRYGHVGVALAGAGYAVYAHDLRGHGHSAGVRAHIDRYDTFLDDMGLYFQTIQAAHPGLPLFVLGHSMGGTLSLGFSLRHQAELAGVVTSGAALIVKKVPQSIAPLIKVLAAIVPKAGLTPLDAADISRDPQVVSAYDSDPLVYRGKARFSMARLFADLPAMLRRELPRLKIPALVMHGAADQLIASRGSEEIYGLLASADKTLKLYDGLYHEIFNEPEQQMVLAEVTAWLDAHLAVPALTAS